MTREEQLDWLCRLRSEIYVYMPKEWLIFMHNALDMAIEELEQKSTTKNDLGVDCISRADARKAIIDHQYSDRFCVEHNIDHSINTSMALIVLGDLPSVTPQEPILDKIRTEIGKALSDETISDNSQLISDVGIGLELALSIINKYMAEREEE